MIDADRFWQHCVLLDDSDDTCWIWTGAQREDGRGRFFVSRRVEILAHHAAYELRHQQPVPEGYRLIQECANPNCVRHWRLDRPHRKLSAQAKDAIQRSYLPTMKLAAMYGVGSVWIWRLRRRRTYAT